MEIVPHVSSLLILCPVHFVWTCFNVSVFIPDLCYSYVFPLIKMKIKTYPDWVGKLIHIFIGTHDPKIHVILYWTRILKPTANRVKLVGLYLIISIPPSLACLTHYPPLISPARQNWVTEVGKHLSFQMTKLNYVHESLINRAEEEFCNPTFSH